MFPKIWGLDPGYAVLIKTLYFCGYITAVHGEITALWRNLNAYAVVIIVITIADEILEFL